MEDPAPYANARTGLYWVGHILFYYNLIIARIEKDRSKKQDIWNVRYDLPISTALIEVDFAEDLEQVKQHVHYAAQLMIDKIRSYE